LSLRRGEAEFAGTIGQPPGEKRLAASVFAANRFEHAAAGSNLSQFVVESGLEALQADSKGIEVAARHGSATQGVDDFLASLRAEGHGSGSKVNEPRNTRSTRKNKKQIPFPTSRRIEWTL
jgi:hypothetical protein